MKTHEEEYAKEKKWEFTSLDTYYIVGFGKSYLVKNPINCVNFDWIIGEKVIIDGIEQEVIGVELKRTKSFYSEGEEVILKIKDYHLL